MSMHPRLRAELTVRGARFVEVHGPLSATIWSRPGPWPHPPPPKRPRRKVKS